MLPAASRPGVPSSAPRSFLGADRAGNDVLREWGWLSGSFKKIPSESRKLKVTLHQQQLAVLGAGRVTFVSLNKCVANTALP